MTSSATPPAAAIPAEASEQGHDAIHVILFWLGDQSFGFQLRDIREILRPPPLAQMPLGPTSLLGLANLRGVVLPVIGLRRLLGLRDVADHAARRIIVIERGAPVGFLVDRIERLLVAPARQVSGDEAGAGAIHPDLLHGVIKGAEGSDSIKILDPERLLRDQFAKLGDAGPRAHGRVSLASRSGKRAAKPEPTVALLSFDLDAQEYALPLDCVREVIVLPEHIAELPRSETAVLGVVTLRDRLLPLVSLRTLLGLPDHSGPKARARVVVLSIGHGAVGVVTDRSRDILRVDPGLIDPAPALLTRGAGDAEISAICRLDRGERLVAVLSPDRLFRADLMRRLLTEQGEANRARDGDIMSGQDFVIFRLGEQDYGLPIAAVDEVARRPESITRLPKAPDFLEGVMNLRGEVVPIIGLRGRFEVSALEPTGKQRVIIVTLGGGKTGFMVDSVSEVLKLPDGAISSAPEVSSANIQLIDRVANLEAQRRIIPLIDPTKLLDQVEADVLAKFNRGHPEPVLKAS
jgi:purine-binding chemotaxis protein CheW